MKRSSRIMVPILMLLAILMVLSICLLFPITEARAFILSGNSLTANYHPPGARANAMGGAFIGLADDATAAYTNPAGLSILTSPEVAVEYNYYIHTTRSYDQSNVKNGTDYDSTTSGVSFASFSYPAGKFNITIYRHQAVDSENSFQQTVGLKSPYPDMWVHHEIDDNLRILTYGLSAAYRVLPNLSLGLSVGFDELDTSHSSTTIGKSGSWGSSTDTYWDGNDQTQHFSLSLLWTPFSTFSIGMVYRYGPAFEYNAEVTNIVIPTVDGGTSISRFKDKIKFPDFFGVGISYRFPFGLTAAMDVNYIRYSQLFKDGVFSDGTTTLGPIDVGEYKLDDAFEFHAGVEYAFNVKGTPLAIRGGYCYKQDHSAYYEPNPGTMTPLLTQTMIKNGLGQDDDQDEHIFSFGFGAVLGKNFQVDVSGRWGKIVQEYTTSLVYRF